MSAIRTQSKKSLTLQVNPGRILPPSECLLCRQCAVFHSGLMDGHGPVTGLDNPDHQAARRQPHLDLFGDFHWNVVRRDDLDGEVWGEGDVLVGIEDLGQSILADESNVRTANRVRPALDQESCFRA